MYCNVVTAIDKIPTYLLRFNSKEDGLLVWLGIKSPKKRTTWKCKTARVLWADGIPTHRKLRFLSNNIIMKHCLDILVLKQPKLAQGSDTHEGMCWLDRKLATDIGQDEAALAEHLFNVNSGSLKEC